MASTTTAYNYKNGGNTFDNKDKHSSVDGYTDVNTGNYTSFGNGYQNNDYGLDVPLHDSTTFGASKWRIADTNNSFNRSMNQQNKDSHDGQKPKGKIAQLVSYQ